MWQCSGTTTGEVKMSSYSSMALSIYCWPEEGSCLEVMTIVFFFLEGISSGKTLLVLEMSLLYCFRVTREIAVGVATFGIMYNLFPNVTMTMWGLDSYTSCHLYKYGWPNNTSQISREATSHNTSSVKGFMLYERWHCSFMCRTHPCWSHLIMYIFGCAVVGKPIRFMTFAAMGFFWLLLLTMNCSRESFTHI